jgi:hypothetical protein
MNTIEVEMAMSNNISRENGRLVISTAKSGRVILSLALLLFAGVAIWMVLGLVYQELGSRVGLYVAVGLGVLLLLCVASFREILWVGAVRQVVQGERIIFDRGQDCVLRNGQQLAAALSSVKKVQVEARAQDAPGRSAALLAQDDAVVLRIITSSKGEAERIAEEIAEYTGVVLTRP